MATEYIYEILVRGNASGLVGAHVIRGKRVTDEDGDVREKTGKAEPLAIADVKSVLGEELTKYTTQVADLQAANDALQIELQTAQAAASKAQAANASLERLNHSLQMAVETLKLQIGEHSCSHAPPDVSHSRASDE